MQIWESIKVAIDGKSSKVRTLFDSGSSFTVMGYTKFKEISGEVPIKPLPKPYEGAPVNGQRIVIDSYVDAQMVIDNYPITERIYLSEDIAKGVVLKDR